MKPRVAVEIAMAQEGDIMGSNASIGVGQLGATDANAGMVPITAMLGNQGVNSVGGANALNDFVANEPLVMD